MIQKKNRRVEKEKNNVVRSDLIVNLGESFRNCDVDGDDDGRKIQTENVVFFVICFLLCSGFALDFLFPCHLLCFFLFFLHFFFGQHYLSSIFYCSSTFCHLCFIPFLLFLYFFYLFTFLFLIYATILSSLFLILALLYSFVSFHFVIPSCMLSVISLLSSVSAFISLFIIYILLLFYSNGIPLLLLSICPSCVVCFLLCF